MKKTQILQNLFTQTDALEKSMMETKNYGNVQRDEILPEYEHCYETVLQIQQLLRKLRNQLPLSDF